LFPLFFSSSVESHATSRELSSPSEEPPVSEKSPETEVRNGQVHQVVCRVARSKTSDVSYLICHVTSNLHLLFTLQTSTSTEGTPSKDPSKKKSKKVKKQDKVASPSVSPEPTLTPKERAKEKRR